MNESPLLALGVLVTWFGLSALLAFGWARLHGQSGRTCYMPGCDQPATHRSRRDADVLLCGADAADEFYADMGTKEAQR